MLKGILAQNQYLAAALKEMKEQIDGGARRGTCWAFFDQQRDEKLPHPSKWGDLKERHPLAAGGRGLGYWWWVIGSP